METSMGLDGWAYWLVVGFPTLLLVLMLALGRLERWMIRPDERAAEVARVLEQTEKAEEVEVAVAKLLADVPARREDTAEERSRWSAATGLARRTRRRAGQHAGR